MININLINKYICKIAHLEPFVNTLGMEFMITGQYSQQLPRLKITHAHYTPTGKEGNILP